MNETMHGILRAGGCRALRGLLAVVMVLAPAGGAAEGESSSPARAVAVTDFADVRVRTEHSAPAEVVALARARVAARLSAPVETLHVEVGDLVQRGDRIARLECADYSDRLEQAEGRHDELEVRRSFARSRLERTRRLRDQGAASAEVLDEVEAELDALTASLRSQRGILREASRAVERCDVTAPFTGMVTARTVSEGDWAQPGMEIVQLLDMDRVELRAQLPARQWPAEVELTGAEFRAGGQAYPVEQRGAVAESDPATRMREVRLRFAAEVPLVGISGRLHWHDATPAVPAHLLVRRNGALGVMIARDETARFHDLPAAVDGRAAPGTGLVDSDRLIIEGRHGVRDGDSIRFSGDDAEPAAQ